jgi:signal transduction histidine kinase
LRRARASLALLVALLALFFVVRHARAEPARDEATEVTAGGRVDLRRSAQLFVDDSGRSTFADAQRALASGSFVDATSVPVHQGFSDAAYWVTLTLRASEPGDALRFVRVFHTNDHVEVYVVSPSGAVQLQHAGRREAFALRPVADVSLLFPVRLPPREPTRLFVRIASHDVVRLDLELFDAPTVAAEVAERRLIWGLGYGVVAALVLYNLVLLVWRPDRAYLYYVVFQGSLAMLNASFDQLTLRYLWPRSPDWSSDFETIAVMMAVFGACGFVRTFLGTPAWPVPGARLLRRLQWVAGGLLLGFPWTDSRVYAVTCIVFVLVATIAVLTTAARAAMQGNPGARFFLPAWVLLMASATIIVVSALTQLDVRVPMEQLLRLSTVSEALLLSFGLVHRVSLIHSEHERMGREMLRQRIASLDHLVSGVVHEVSNPLHFVRSGAELLVRKLGASASPDVKDALEIVGNGAERIGAIVASLRQQTSSSREVVLAPADVGKVVQETLTLMRGKVDKAGVRVERALDGLPLVAANAGELGQVFSNLILNACQAMPAGGTLRIEGTARGRTVDVVVSDTGQGVAPEHRGAIFDPFFTTRGPNDGTGLGLYVCLQIVANRGGAIRLEPSDGGARFLITLPAADA